MTADNQDFSGSADQLLAQAEKLIWSLLDDTLPADDVQRLEEMIHKHDQVRDLYLDCVHLHADLAGHFARAGKANTAGPPVLPESPVLGSLGDVVPGMDAGPPVTS